MVRSTNATGARTTIFRFIVTVTIIISTWAPTQVAACYNQTYERCTLDGHCFNNRFCVTMNKTSLFPFCPSPSTSSSSSPPPPCVCSPTDLFPSSCTSDAQCAEYEVCAIEKRHGDLFDQGIGTAICVGCNALSDDEFDFELIDDNADNNKCAMNTDRPVCGRSLNYCNANDMPCTAYHNCVETLYNDKFRCSASSVGCQCEPKWRDGLLKPCGNSTSSPTATCGRRQVCAYSVITGENVCISCDALEENAHFTAGFEQQQTSCKYIKERAIPSYIDSPNGRNFDYCDDDVMCAAQQKTCQQYKQLKTPSAGLTACMGMDELCFCHTENVQQCETSAISCGIGEVCADVTYVTVGKQCVSTALLNTVPDSFFTAYGAANEPEQLVTGMTRDACRFDWDCQGERRCTHFADKFGGCGGRDSCTCEPLIFPRCVSDADCDSHNDGVNINDKVNDNGGEACVNYVDAKTRPFCISRQVAKKDPIFFSVSSPPSFTSAPRDNSTTTNGYTMDACTTSDDCKQGRRCKHVTEEGVDADMECDGSRRFCVCKRDVSDPKSGCTGNRNGDGGCDEGETCAAMLEAFPVVGYCLSKEYVSRLSRLYYEL